MLAWATRENMEIYQSICRAKLKSKQMIVPSWTISDPDRTVESEKKVDRRRVTHNQKKRDIKKQE